MSGGIPRQYDGVHIFLNGYDEFVTLTRAERDHAGRRTLQLPSDAP